MATLRPFARDTLAAIERAHAGQPFWLVLWDLECAYCAQSLRNLAQAQQAGLRTRVVTIATDPMTSAALLRQRLAALGVESDAYAFAGGPPEVLRFAIDPEWAGEKPRSYRYDAAGRREPINGVISVQRYQGVAPR